MKKLILTFIMLIFLADSAYAKFFLDGNDWKRFTDYESSNKMVAKTYKLLLVRGIYDGVGFSGDKEAKSMFILPAGDLDFGLVVDGLDHLYSDYRNINIPIVCAIPIIILEIRGENPQKIEEVKRGLRREHMQ